jgi:hypothetical protein
MVSMLSPNRFANFCCNERLMSVDILTHMRLPSSLSVSTHHDHTELAAPLVLMCPSWLPVTLHQLWEIHLNKIIQFYLLWGGRLSGQSLSPSRGKIFLPSTSRPVLGPTEPHIEWVLGVLSLGVKRTEREANHSPQTSAKVKNTWIYTSTPLYVFMA